MMIIISILSFSLISTVIYFTNRINNIQKQLIELDKEQHTQNVDILKGMKQHTQHQEMLLQHIEILKYLVEKDDVIGKGRRVIYPMTMGEA